MSFSKKVFSINFWMEILLVFVAIFLKQKHGNFSFSESSLGNSCHFYLVAKNKGLKNDSIS